LFPEEKSVPVGLRVKSPDGVGDLMPHLHKKVI